MIPPSLRAPCHGPSAALVTGLGVRNGRPLCAPRALRRCKSVQLLWGRAALRGRVAQCGAAGERQPIFLYSGKAGGGGMAAQRPRAPTEHEPMLVARTRR